MASRRFVPCLTLSVCIFLVGSAPTAVAEADAPSIWPGDYWTYRTNTSFTEGFFLAGTATFTIAARETISVAGTDHDAFRVLVSGEGSVGGRIPTDAGSIPVTGSWDLVGEQAIESAGLKIVSSFLHLNADGHTEPFEVPFSIRVRNSTTFEILEDRWRFPVDVEDEGHVTAGFDTWENVSFAFGIIREVTNLTGAGQRTLTYRVEGRTTVEVPAGRFEVYRINETWPDGRYDLLFFAPAAGNNVRTESYNETGSRVATTNLTGYRYQALEPETFLGLTLVQWAIVAPAIAAVAAIASWTVLRSRRPVEPGSPPPPSAP